MKYSKGMLYGVLGLILAHPAYAQTLDCIEQHNCSELGYSNQNEPCLGNSYITCPFDSSYKKCVPVSPDCETLGFTTGDNKEDWCKDIVVCPTDASYTLCNMHNIQERCSDYNYWELGDSNFLCLGTVEVQLTTGKTITCARDCIEFCSDLGEEWGADECYDLGFAPDDVWCEEKSQTYYVGGESDKPYICGKNCKRVFESCEEAELYEDGLCKSPTSSGDFINTETCYSGIETIYRIPTSTTGDGSFIECTEYCDQINSCPDLYSYIPECQYANYYCSSVDPYGTCLEIPNVRFADGTVRTCYRCPKSGGSGNTGGNTGGSVSGGSSGCSFSSSTSDCMLGLESCNACCDGRYPDLYSTDNHDCKEPCRVGYQMCSN